MRTGKTQLHKWYHNIAQLWCFVFGHNTFAGFDNDGGFDYCRRCERCNDGWRLPSLNLWALYIRHKIARQIAKEQR